MIGEGGASDFAKKEVWITRNTGVIPCLTADLSTRGGMSSNKIETL